MLDLSRRRPAVLASWTSAAALALLAGMPAQGATDATKIGTAAAARPGVTGTPPAQDKRVIEVGTNLLADERIVTAPNAQAQILFNDGSSFSVGPDSDIVIDKFVFDPETGNGEMSLSVGKGVFRFVGGKISKNAEVQVRTPTATMGIRGGIATLSVQPGQPVVGKFLFGKQMSMLQNGITQVTNRPGTVIEAPPGAPPNPPRPATPAEIRQTMSQLEASSGAAPAAPAGGSGGGDGGGGGGQQQVAAAPAPAPIESQMESSGISQSNSSVAPAAVTVTPTTATSPAAAPTPAPAPTPTVVVNPDPTPVVQPTPSPVTATFDAVRGRTLLQGLGVQPFNASGTPGLTATQNGSASIGVSGLTTTTTAGVGTWSLALPGSAGAVSLALPIANGSSFGTGSLFNVSQGLALNAVASIAAPQSNGLTGIKYEGYFNDNLNFFNTASVQFDTRFVNPFTAINTTTPGANFDDTYSVRFFGFFRPTQTGIYNFLTASDDASYLWLGNADETVVSLEARRALTGGSGIVVNNGGQHGVNTRFGSTATLQAGEDYPILVYFGENGGGDQITVDFRGPSDDGFRNNGQGFFFSTGSGSSSTQVEFAGTTLGGFGYRAENASDFLFYALASATPTTDFSPEALADIVRLTHYEGTPTAAANFPTSGFGVHETFGQFGFDSVPFVGDHLVSPANFAASPIISRYDSNISAANFASSDSRSVLMQGTLGIFGQGAGQVSYLVGMTGIYLLDPATSQVTASGGMSGTARLDAEGRPLSFSSNVGAAETASGGSAIFGSSGQFMVFTPDEIAFNTGTGAITRTTGVTLVEPLATDAPVNELALTVGVGVAPGPLLTGTSRTTRTIAGFAGGLIETRFSDGSLASADTIISSSAVQISTNATTNRLAATFQLGLGEGSTAVGFGSLSGEGTNSAFINDALFAAREASSGGEGTTTRAIMISHDVVPIEASAFAPAGVNFCDCPFMQWGWWASSVSQSGGQRDVVQLATWVAGTLANVADIPVNGTATYSGHAIGNVNNNGTRYVAMGNFSQSWNFATKSGVASISNFDSLTVNLNTASGNGRDFSSTGIAAGTSAMVTGAGLAGAFYRAPADVAGIAPSGAAGQFAITATGNYQAAGTFVARK